MHAPVLPHARRTGHRSGPAGQAAGGASSTRVPQPDTSGVSASWYFSVPPRSSRSTSIHTAVCGRPSKLAPRTERGCSAFAPLASTTSFLPPASVPAQPVVQHTGEMKGAPLTIAVATGANGSSCFFQDAGDGYGYRKGQSRTIVVTQDETGVRLDIPRNRGWQRIEAVEFVGIGAAPALVRIDGKPARDVRFDARTRRLRVALPNEGVKRIELSR